jgi:hypothetical protein
MAQTGRPASDITTGSWGTAPLWSKINEDSDAVYISTTAAASTGEVKLGTLSTPIGEGHVVTIRAYAAGSGAAERLNTWGLYQGSTAIATLNSSITRNSFNAYTITLSSAQIAAITNYTDLRVRFTAAQAAGETLRVSNITFVIPDGAPPLDEMTAVGIDAGAPTLGTPALAQVHVMGAVGVATGAPALGSPALTQVHILVAVGVATGAPTLGTPVLVEESGTDELTALGVDAGAPVLGTPALTQLHVMAASGIVAGAPTVGTPTLGQVHIITAVGITAGTPSVGTPAVGQVHIMAAVGIDTGAPVLGTPTLEDIPDDLNILTALGVVAGAPELGSPVLSQIHVLIVVALTAGVPVLGEPELDNPEDDKKIKTRGRRYRTFTPETIARGGAISTYDITRVLKRLRRR